MQIVIESIILFVALPAIIGALIALAYRILTKNKKGKIMELNDAIKTLVEAMNGINAKIDNEYLSIELNLFKNRDFTVRTYADKFRTSFTKRYNLCDEHFDITDDSLVDGLRQEANNAKARIKEKIQEHVAAIDELKSEIKELDAAMGKEDKNEQ